VVANSARRRDASNVQPAGVLVHRQLIR
jgi:hypothetical protein